MVKRNKKSGVAAAACVLFVATTLVACSGKDDQSSSGPTSSDGVAKSTSEVSGEITYAFWDENQRSGIEKNIADFNEIYPNVKVTMNVTPWAQYWTKLQTQAESNSLPDVFWINGPNIALYGSNGMIEPITSLVDDGRVDPGNYPAALNDLYTIDEVQYAVPKDFDTIAVFYNKSLFDEAGVAYPEAGWDWQQFNKTASDLKGALPEGTYAVATGVEGQSGYYNTILQAGGTLFGPDASASGFDTPEAIEGLQFWADLVSSGISPTPQQLSDVDAATMFKSGKAAMTWTGTWAVSNFKESEFVDDFDVVELPTGKVQATVIHGLANAVAAGTSNMEAAQAFLAYLGSEEAQRSQAESGSANPAFNGTQDAFVESVPNWNLQVFEQAAEYAQPYPVALNGQAIMDAEAELLPAAFSGDKPVADVAAELAARANEYLAEK